MLKQVKRFSVHQTAKVIAVCYGFVFFILFLIAMPFMMANGSMGVESLFMAVIVPLFYFVFFYLTTALSLLIYNYIAHWKWVGGIEVEIGDKQGE